MGIKITATVTVNKVVTVFSAEDFVMKYQDGNVWNLTLTDTSGNAFANTYVKVSILGKIYNMLQKKQLILK